MKPLSRLSLPTSFAASLMLALLAGCATGPRIATHPDPQVRFQNYRSFAVAPGDRAPRDPQITPEIVRGVRDAAAQAFSRRGLQEVPTEQADVVVLVHGGIQEHVDIRDLGFNYGRFHRWGWGPGPYELSQYREGTLIVDVFDAKTRELLWRGTAVGEVVGPPDLQRIRAALNDIVNRFPA